MQTRVLVREKGGGFTERDLGDKGLALGHWHRMPSRELMDGLSMRVGSSRFPRRRMSNYVRVQGRLHLARLVQKEGGTEERTEEGEKVLCGCGEGSAVLADWTVSRSLKVRENPSSGAAERGKHGACTPGPPKGKKREAKSSPGMYQKKEGKQ
ncbi:hypothetical protein K438DRAFT_1758014 [Mycena galopus ATCC 62051]|nr:hypothetical protein K438DRAFT_1758014 [Mycena galopus ATCC 62051]